MASNGDEPTKFNPQLLADELYRAAKQAQPVHLLTKRFPDLDWDGARQVARATDALRSSAGEIQVGWKLGWTSAAMRRALGVNRPNWGTLWQSQILQQPQHLDLTAFIHPKVEPELVWRCPSDISGVDVTADDIAELGGHWALGLEVVDPRFPSFSFDALDNTADNSSSAAVAVGQFVSAEELRVGSSGGPTELSVSFTDDYETRNGVGSNAMDSPLEAVAWFVRAMAVEGLTLGADQIVFTGGLTAPFDVAAKATYRLTGSPLPAVSFSVD